MTQWSIGFECELAYLISSPKGSAEGYHYTLEQQFTIFRQTSIDHRNQGSINMCESGRCKLGFHDCTRQESTPTHQVISKEVRQHRANIGNTDFVDHTIDAFSQSFPV